MIKRLVFVAVMALVCAGCLGSAHNSENCREWEFNGERLCQDPETAEIDISFLGLTPGDMNGMLVEISPDDAATNRLEEATPLVSDDRAPNFWIAYVARTGPGIQRNCFVDGAFLSDPAVGVRWQIIKPGECTILDARSFGLRQAIWE